jgi:hypothetical protein
LDVTLAVAADYANITSDGKLNIMGIFQEVNPVGFPTQLQQMFLVISFEAGPAEFGAQKAVHIAFTDADGNQKVTLDVPVVVPRPVRPGSRAYFSQVIGLGGLPIEEPGDHEFAILVGGETRGSVLLHVNEPSHETLESEEV